MQPLVPIHAGFDTLCLHAGYSPIGDENVYGLGQGAPRGVPLHRSAPYQVLTPCSLEKMGRTNVPAHFPRNIYLV